MSKNIFFNNISNIFDKNDIKTDISTKEIYRNDWSTNFQSDPIAIVFPRTSQQIIDIIQLCNEFSHPLIGSGGRTGLSGGASAISNELIVSFDKMNNIIDFDKKSKTVLCQPGTITQNIQLLAEDNNLYYPINFSSAGSSQIGGNIATNAGGIRVIKYGLTSKYVAGLDVVTGSGKLISLDDMLLKNATGPDFKSFFIGSEGIFALTTSCRMQLISKPNETSVFLVGLNKISSIEYIMNSIFQFDLEAIEFFTRNSINQVKKEFKNIDISQLDNNYYLIIELENDKKFVKYLEKIYENNEVQEIIISRNNAQKESIWQYRLLISESLTRYLPMKFDIAVPKKNVTQLIYKLEHFFNDNSSYNLILFGHLGDGNLHINVLSKDRKYNKTFIENNIYNLVNDLDGTISAEHGIGINKLEKHLEYGNEEKIALISNLKKYFDPNAILNPGKLVK